MSQPFRTVEVSSGAYADSVTLMQVSQQVSRLPGVQAAMVAMATELNAELIRGMGFDIPPTAGPADLLVAVAADDEAAATAAVVEAARLRAASAGGSAGGGRDEAPARTVRTAAHRAGADIAVISLPGRLAFAEAMDAIESGLSVMLFSDNVPLDQEIALKDAAERHGVLVMGPDCGTAVVNGVGLGFANVVQPGSVSLVAASGTGAQQVLSLLDAAGVGVTHCLGVGGRDLSAAVAARSTRRALVALDSDPGTDLVVVVSKPPASEVAERVRSEAGDLHTPVEFMLLGPGQPDLTAGVERVLDRVGVSRPAGGWPRWLPERARSARPGVLRGLFSGGTLCDEAMVIAAGELGPIASNIPLQPDWGVGPELDSPGHLMLDFGDDALTQGRAHPMIDPSLRLERLAAALAEPTTSVVLLDVVLGYAAHPDPASELAPLVAGSAVPVVVSLCGTSGDPQGLATQAETLARAGAEVYLSNAEAARRAVALVTAAEAAA
ncbi:MAG: hypothetical protein ACTHK1_16125 [Actinomycetales bacterium]